MTGSSPARRIALAILRLAPAGGLEQHVPAPRRDPGAARLRCDAGHDALPAASTTDAAVELIPARGRTNHDRLAAFDVEAASAAADQFDVTVAFHAKPGFDLIFCADPSRSSRAPLKRWLPRYAAYARLEREAFAAGQLGRALLLSSAQLEGFARNTGAPRDRLTLLPPTVDHLRANPPTPAIRAAARAQMGLGDEVVWLWMGLQAKTKGLDRALAALAAAPDAHLLVCGLDPASRGGAQMRRLAERLGVGARINWLGFTDDAGLARAMAAADLLVHPSRADVTGTVILEAMANGLPVITTALCGYGEHVTAADAGIVLPEPFRPADLAAAVRAAPERAAAWSANALAYTRRDDLFSGLERAADVILEAGRGP